MVSNENENKGASGTEGPSFLRPRIAFLLEKMGFGNLLLQEKESPFQADDHALAVMLKLLYHPEEFCFMRVKHKATGEMKTILMRVEKEDLGQRTRTYLMGVAEFPQKGLDLTEYEKPSEGVYKDSVRPTEVKKETESAKEENSAE